MNENKKYQNISQKIKISYPQFHSNSPSQYAPKASKITAKIAVTAFIIIYTIKTNTYEKLLNQIEILLHQQPQLKERERDLHIE
jgi:hypothetical protein